ncbi:MAG: protein kinase [Candidatus Aminicenantes bacterium]|nr:protein kinase [Candidatus Aminicenantes bacterium]
MKCPKCHFANPDDTLYCGKCATPLKEGVSVSRTKTLETPVMEMEKGATFAGKYKIIEELGRGGMGIVYKSEDTKLKRPVALKFLPQELVSDPEAKERFVREAQAAAALDHPNICTVYEVDEAEGKAYISMAYVEGQSLKKRIEQKPLAVDEVLDIAIQVAEGLEEAHNKGIIHRDIKIANIMVDRKGQAKVMDFGLAKIRGGAQVTREGTTIGTVAYMSPEQARGKTVDHRTDIWSFGVVLYEMICGQTPFEGETEASILYSIVHEEPKPIKDSKPGIPDEFAKIINRALKKKPESRYQSMAGVLKDLRQYKPSLKAEEVGIKDLKSLIRLMRRTYVAIPAVLVVLALCIFAVWSFKRNTKVRWARNEIIPEIIQLAEEENYLEAFKLAREVEKVIPEDPLLAKIWPAISIERPMRIEPLGADVFMKDLGAQESGWVYFGKTSKELMRIPKYWSGWTPRIKIQQEGYETLDVAHTISVNRTLSKKGSIPLRMVRVPVDRMKRRVRISLYAYESLKFVQIRDFLIDKFEVTNREFKEFVESGGYEKPGFWKYQFRKNGKILSWEEAMALFRDSTGRPGPATWEFGNYPEGQEEFPVTGVSWYEAAAYAEYIGKRLPTIYHWEKVSSIRYSGNVIPGSNFGTSGLAPVGSYQGGLGTYGTYDTAGNAREWCSNSTGEMRFTVGGAWKGPTYFFTEPDVRSPFDRDSGNGFRCMKLLTEESTSEDLERPLNRITPLDWSKEKPFSDDIFNAWLSFISYPKTPLNSKVELRDDTPKYWVKEKITFDAAYNNERMLAYLFLPKNTLPPYQVIIYWPGINAAYVASSQNGNLLLRKTDYFVKDGRALLYPILKGTYERGGAQIPDREQLFGEMMHNKDMTVKHMKDIMRSIDYLESRDDIDSEKLAYCGVSWGAHMGAFPCALEKRIKTGILIAGTIRNRDQYSCAHRVKIPMLMIHGQHDTTFPLEKTVKPLFRALGTPEEHKRLEILDSDHYVLNHRSRKEVIKISLGWLDRYLGPVK